jgi:hypothetical protein
VGYQREVAIAARSSDAGSFVTLSSSECSSDSAEVLDKDNNTKYGSIDSTGLLHCK